MQLGFKILHCLDQMFTRENILQRVDSTSTSESDEAFFECSSLVEESVAREESIPKANQAEEKKLPEQDQVSSVESLETAIFDGALNDHDSGIIDAKSIGIYMKSNSFRFFSFYINYQL